MIKIIIWKLNMGNGETCIHNKHEKSNRFQGESKKT